MDLLQGAYKACPDKSSLGYAHLLGTESSVDYELNKLENSLSSGQKSLDIRLLLLEKDDLELASSYSNMACTMSALGQQEKALEFLNMAEDIESKAGEEAEVSLAITHMLTGRALFLQGEFLSARGRYDLSMTTFQRTLWGDSQLLAQ